MSRLPLGFVLAFLGELLRLRSGSMIADDNGTRGGGGGEVGKTMGSAYLTTTVMRKNTTMTTNTTTQRMGRGHAGERTMGGHLTTSVATLSSHPLGAWGGGL
jgi:hypothetical protein